MLSLVVLSRAGDTAISEKLSALNEVTAGGVDSSWSPSDRMRELPVGRGRHADFEKLSALKVVTPGGADFLLEPF